jgi:hypothetical protein
MLARRADTPGEFRRPERIVFGYLAGRALGPIVFFIQQKGDHETQ